MSAKKLLANELIEWNEGQTFNPTTGEINAFPIKGNYLNMKIKINEKSIVIEGSIHKLSNELQTGQSHNYDDFDYDRLKQIIEHLRDTLGINPSEAIVSNLEYGVNVLLWKPVKEFLSQNIIVKDCKPVNESKWYKTEDRKWKYIQFDMSFKFNKVYDKGEQHGRPYHILRWELKATKNDRLPKVNDKSVVKVLSDLLNKRNLEILRDDLLKEYDELIIVDTIKPPNELEKRELTLWQQGINPKEWELVLGMHNSTKSRRIKRFNHLLHKYERDTYKTELRKRIVDKWNDLISCNKLTDLIKPVINTKCNKSTRKYNVKTLHQEKRQCLSTGIDISHQVETSRFIWEKTIIDLYETDKQNFNDLCTKYLNKNKDYDNLKSIAYYIAHNVRNKYWNKFYQIQKAKIKYQWSLFPLDEFEGLKPTG